MKIQSRITLMLFGLILIISSCKRKEGCTNIEAKNYCPRCKKDNGTCSMIKTGTQIFWFNKATSDSLIAHGYKKLYCMNTGTLAPPNGTVIRTEISTDHFFSSAPSCDEANILVLKLGLYEGESATYSYVVTDSLSYAQSGGTLTPLKNWGDNFTFTAGECKTTQLIW